MNAPACTPGPPCRGPQPLTDQSVLCSMASHPNLCLKWQPHRRAAEYSGRRWAAASRTMAVSVAVRGVGGDSEITEASRRNWRRVGPSPEHGVFSF